VSFPGTICRRSAAAGERRQNPDAVIGEPSANTSAHHSGGDYGNYGGSHHGLDS
jgi:hypothetical protein